MNNLYINCSTGASGDMMLGAFTGLGVPEDYLTDQLKKLKLDGYSLKFERNFIFGEETVDVDVIIDDKEAGISNPYEGNYRNYGDIKELINSSSLPNNVKVLSRRIFDVKASAEAKVHNVDIDDVKFHEAGALDSIIDIVGTAICYDYLKIGVAHSCAVPTGYGTVKCACGELKVPVPAVKRILQDTGMPYIRSDVKQEILTPTGASILAVIADDFRDLEINGKIIKRGFGTGKRDTGLKPLELILYN